jgi:hypothetical protein
MFFAVNRKFGIVDAIFFIAILCYKSSGRFLASGRLLLAACFWPLASGYWLLATGFWLLVSGFWPLAPCSWLLASGFW